MVRELIVYVAILALIWTELTLGVPQMCSVKPSFTSPFVTPYWDESVPVFGCMSRVLAHRSQEVHIIYLKNDEDALPTSARHKVPVVNVHLSPKNRHGVYAGRLILILHAQRTVSWRLIGERISNNDSHHSIVVTRGSQIDQNINLQIVVMRRRETAIARLVSWVIKRYKAVTAFAEMSQANKISVKVGVADNGPRECNIDGRMPSPNVDASLEIAVSPEQQRGCVAMGTTSKPTDKPDVHVINVRHVHSAEEEAAEAREELAANDRPSTDLPGPDGSIGRHRRHKNRVVVEVRSKATNLEKSKEKNIFLVLKAPHSVVWIVRSDDFGGVLKIVAEDPVERPHIPSTQVMHVKTEDLPENADELIFYADNKYGPLVSYFEVDKANKLLLFVDDYDFRAAAPSSVNVTPPEPKLPRQILWPPATTATTASFPSASGAGAIAASVLPPSFVPSSKDLIKAQLGSIRSSKSTGVQVLMKSRGRFTPDGLIQMPNVMLMEAMQVDCMSDYIRVSFSRFTLERLGIRGSDMTLNSPSCRVAGNESHLVLSTYFKGCGTETLHLPQRVVYKNAVNFHLAAPKKIVPASTSTMTMFKESDLLVDDEDQNMDNGSGIDQETWKKNREEEEERLREESFDRLGKPKTLEFQCEYSTTGSPIHEKESNIGDQRSNVSSPRSQIYDLRLYRDPDFRNCFRSTEFPASLLENDRVYVESRIDAGPHLRVVTEECWLSVSDNESVTEGRISLIRNTCPTDLSVQVQRPSLDQRRQVPAEDGGPMLNVGQWNRFNFQVNSDIRKMGPVYLHCMLGVCSVNPQHSNGNVKQCVDIEDYCLKKSFRSFLDQYVGAHHEVLTRGPIHVIPKPDRSFQTALLSSLAPFLSREKKPDMQSAAPFEREKIVIQEPPQVILIGLSTEAVVGIAFASFLIGAALTAVLWIIHLRTDPLRNGRARATAPHHSGYDLSAHSGSSTPSSQVPMTT